MAEGRAGLTASQRRARGVCKPVRRRVARLTFDRCPAAVLAEHNDFERIYTDREDDFTFLGQVVMLSGRHSSPDRDSRFPARQSRLVSGPESLESL